MPFHSQQNPYDATVDGTVKPPAENDSVAHEPNAVLTLVLTATITLVGVFLMGLVRNPFSTLPTLHSDSSFIVGLREAATGPGSFFFYPIALFVVCVPPMILHCGIWLVSWMTGNRTTTTWIYSRRAVHWLSVAYALGWLVCLVV